MSKRVKYSLEVKIKSVEMLLSGKHRICEIQKNTGAKGDTIRSWVSKYKHNGIDGLKESHTWKKYPKELKEAAVQYYLDGKGSMSECCDKYNISNHSLLRQWIYKYNTSSTTTGGTTRMTSARKTTLEERIAIVKNTIAKGNDYAWACKEYNVSYNQIYNWVRKFNDSGIEGLKDRRGKNLKNRDVKSLSEKERQKLEIIKLKEKLAEKEMENMILKKLYALQKVVKK